MAANMNTLPVLTIRFTPRVVAACAVVVCALVWIVLMMNQPPIGSFRARCVDAVDGTPLADVDLTLSPVESETDEPEDRTPHTPFASPDPYGRTEVPSGWKESTTSDNDTNLAGYQTDESRDITETTDDYGMVSFSNLPAGQYRADGYSSGHQLNDYLVIVEAGHAPIVTIEFSRTQPNVNFSDPEPNWLPTEKPVFGLSGVLQSESVQITLERVGVDDALHRDPRALLPGASGPANPPSYTVGVEGSISSTAHLADDWSGKFTIVRSWTHRLTSQDDEGAFQENVAISDTPLPMGVYWVKAEPTDVDEASQTVATAMFVVTNLALVTKTVGPDIRCYVSDLATGKAIGGVGVTLYQGDSGPPLDTAVVGPDGLGRVSAAHAAKESSGTLIARSGDAIAAVSLSLNSPGSAAENTDASGENTGSAALTGGRDLRSLVYTERPVYRPGDMVHMKGIMRVYDPVKGYLVPANQPVTIDIDDSQDNRVDEIDVTTNSVGTWTADLNLNAEALTGQYQITAIIGGASAQATFDVASYHKPEYQVTVTFAKDRYIHGETVHSTITAAYYYGAPVASAPVHIAVARADSETSDEDGGGDQNVAARGSEDTTTPQGNGEPLVDEDALLDANGQFQLDFPTGAQPNQEGGVTYTVTADVKDPSGATIEGTGNVDVDQGDFDLDLEPSSQVCNVGEAIVIDATATNAGGAPRAGQALTIEPYYDSWTSSGEVKTKLAAMTGVTDAGGEARFPITPPSAGYLCFDGSGKDKHGNTVTASSSVWVPSASADVPGRYSDLQIVLDKKKYRPGDTVRALVNTEHPGASALVTVEGRRLYQAFVVRMARRSTEIDVHLTQELVPGVTLSVCSVVNKQFLTSSASVDITDPRLPLEIAVWSDKPSYHPGDLATIHLRTTDIDGHPMPAEVSVGVVDSSIYAIEEDSTPSIEDAFEPDQGDAVQTTDSCERVYYGDVDKGAFNMRIRKKFVDTALWAPDVMTGADGTAAVSVMLPDNLTTWRITCQGVTADTHVGSATATFTENKDLLVRIEAPAFLTAGDTATIVGLVHDNTPRAVHARINFSAEGLDVIGANSSAVDVAPGQPATLAWQVRARHPGTTSVTLAAGGGGLGDAMQVAIPVDPHGVTISTWQSGTLLHYVSSTFNIDPKAIPDSTLVRVHLSPSIASTLLPAFESLGEYPYDCVEASAAVLTSDAVLAAATKTLPNAKPVAAPADGSIFLPPSLTAQTLSPGAAIPFSDAQRAMLRDQVDRCVLRIERMQSPDGGWGWFEGSNADLWDSDRVAWSMLLTRNAGYDVPPKLVEAALNATILGAQTERGFRYPDTDEIARAALVLATGGKRDDAITNLQFVHDTWNRVGIDNEALVLMALTDAVLYGPTSQDARERMGDLWAECRVTGAEASWTRGWHTPGGIGQELPDAETTAWAMVAAQRIDPNDPRIDGIARWIVANRKGPDWSDPSCTATVLYALTGYIEATHEMAPSFTATVTVDGTPVQTVPFNPDSINQPDAEIDIPMSAFKAGANTIEFAKAGSGRLYYSVEVRQCLAQPPPPTPPSVVTRFWRAFVVGQPPLPPAPSGFRIKRQYLRLTSRRNAFWEDTVPAPDTAYNTDETIEVRLIIDATRPVSRMVITEPIPAGCASTDLAYDECDQWTNWWDFEDIRDDKITFFVSDMSTGEHEIDYHLTASTAGAFDVMPTSVASMVDPTVSAVGVTSHITVDRRTP